MYNKDALFQYLENRGLKKPVIEELYKIHSLEKKSIKVRKSESLTNEDILKVIQLEENLLKELQR